MSSDLYLLALEAIKDGVFLVDDTDHITYVNKAVLDMWGYETASELIGKPLSVLFSSEQYDVLERDARQALRDRSDEKWDCNMVGKRKKQGDFYLHLTLSCHSNGGTVGLVRNQDEMLQYVAIANERLAAIEMATDGVAIIDEHGKLTYMNNALMDLHGIEEHEVDLYLGRPWGNLFSEKEQEDIFNLILPQMQQAGKWEGEMKIARKDDRIVVAEMALNKLHDGGMIGSARDISRRKKVEHEKDFLQRQVFQAQKMEAIGRFASGIAHDFNNILASMIGYTSFLIEDLEDKKSEHKFATQIMKGGLQAQQLVEQILTYSRKNDGHRDVVNLSEVVDETESILRSVIPPTVSLRITEDQDDLSFNANTTQVSQTLMNLCVNAMDAMMDKGELVIAINNYPAANIPEKRQAEEVQNENKFYSPVISTQDDGRKVFVESGAFIHGRDYICVSVQDTGCGFDKNIAQRMFDPFFTTKPVDEGTGLGLSTVQGIVITHEGVLEVVSERDVGTCFKLYFPRAKQSRTKLADNQEDVGGALGAKILVVDDQEDVRFMLSHMLSRIGYDHSLACDADEAVDMLRENPYRFDLVLSDYAMPGLSGVEFAKIVAEDFPELPFVLMSGHGRRKMQEVLKGCDVVKGTLTKPISRKQLSKMLNQVLAEHMGAVDKARSSFLQENEALH